MRFRLYIFELVVKFGSHYYFVSFTTVKPLEIANFLDLLYVAGDLKLAIDAELGQ